jgi:hypothetical protein
VSGGHLCEAEAPTEATAETPHRIHKTEETAMKNITKKELNRIAKKYGCDPQYLEDQVLDWEGDGIRVDTQDLEDYCANGDI